MEKVLTIRLRTKADGTVELERVATGLDRIGKEGADAAKGADQATRAMRAQASAADDLGGGLSSVGSSLKSLGPAIAAMAAALGATALIRRGYEYHQQLEQQRITIAGLLSAQMEYVDATGRVLDSQESWNVSLAESTRLVELLDRRSYETAATVPQMGRAFAEVLSGAQAKGLKFTLDELLDVTTRIVQTAGAFDRLGELPSEIRALFGTGSFQDSLLATRLFGTPDELKQALNDGTALAEIVQRSGAYADAAAAQSETLRSSFNTLGEEIDSLVAAGLDEFFGETNNHVQDLGDWVRDNREELIAGFDSIASAIAGIGTAAGTAVGGLMGAGGLWDTLKAFRDENQKTVTPFLEWDKKQTDRLWDFFTTGGGDGKTIDPSLAAFRRSRGFMEEAGTVVGLPPVQGPPAPAGSPWWRRDSPRPGQTIYPDFLPGVVPSSVVYDHPPTPTPTATTKRTGGGGESEDARKQREKLNDIRDGWFRWFEDFQAEAAAAGDPLAEAIARIEKERGAAIAKLEDTQKKLKGALGFDAAEGRAAIEGVFDAKVQQAIDADFTKQIEAGYKRFGKVYDEATKRQQQFADDHRATEEMRAAITADVEAERIAAITDTIQRTLEERLLAIKLEAEADRQRVQESIKSEEERSAQLGMIEAERLRKTKAANDAAEKQRREQMTVTGEWSAKVNQQISQQFLSTADSIASAIVDSTGAIRGAFDDLFNGDGGLSGIFEGFADNMRKIWSQRISDMFTKAILGQESLATQLRGIWDSMGAVKEGGGADYSNRMLAGAGVGSMIGGMFGKDGTQGDLGGMVGGAIGAIWGPIGGMLGSLFGTLIGSLIKKSQDWINVAIVDGVVNVTEKGIDRETRLKMQDDIAKQLEGLEEQYGDILDLFPEEVRARIAAAVKKVNATDRVTGEDITEDAALLMFSDFLSEDLPAAVFGAYRDAIGEGLELMGVEAGKVSELMAHWGTLTGEQLRAAIYEFVDVVRDYTDLSTIYGGTFTGIQDEARRRSARTSFSPIAELNEQMAKASAELAGMDIEDQAAAMARINDMRRQGLEMEIQLLQQIDATEKALLQQSESFRNQIEFQRIDPEDKQAQVDFYERLYNETIAKLRQATDPAEIQRLYNEAMGYMQSAFGIAPDDPRLQQDLLDTLATLELLMQAQMSEARDEVRELDLQAGQTLLEAGEALLAAGEALGGGPGETPQDPETGDPVKNPPELGVISNSVTGMETHVREIAEMLRRMQAVERPIVIEVDGNVAAALEQLGIQIIARARQVIVPEAGQAAIDRIRRDRSVLDRYVG